MSDQESTACRRELQESKQVDEESQMVLSLCVEDQARKEEGEFMYSSSWEPPVDLECFTLTIGRFPKEKEVIRMV